MQTNKRTHALQHLPLRHNFFWSLTGSVGSAASQWAIIVILAKFGSPTMVGIYAFALAISAPILLFAQLNLRIIQVSYRDGEYHFYDFLSVRIAGSLVALVAVGLFAVATDHGPSVQVVVLLVALAKAIDGIGDVVHGQFHRHERMNQQAQSLLLRGCLQILTVYLALELTQDVTWVAAALVVSSTAVCGGFDLVSIRRLSQDLAAPGVLGRGYAHLFLVRTALPLGIIAVLGALYQNIPRYALADQLGVAAVGYFSAIFYLTYVGFTVVGSLGSTFMPRLARNYVQNPLHFRKLAIRLAFVGATVGLVATLVALLYGRALLTLLYTPDYAQHESTLQWVMISSTIWYMATMLSYASMAAKQYVPLAILHALAAAVTWALCPPLIDMYAMDGAAMALASGVTLLLGGEVVLLWGAIQQTALTMHK